jgi:hypothetical protein
MRPHIKKLLDDANIKYPKKPAKVTPKRQRLLVLVSKKTPAKVRKDPAVVEAERLLEEGRQTYLRGLALSLGQIYCAACHGTGQTQGRANLQVLCQCVKRQVFRIVFKCYLRLDGQPATPQYELTKNGMIYGLPGIEFRADFESTALRVLTEEEHRIYRYHFLLEADWRLCCRKLRMDRGTFFHAVYRIQQKMGAELLAMQPASMFPTSNYFRSHHRVDPTLFAKPRRMNNQCNRKQVALDFLLFHPNSAAA